ncbi:protein of unknown function [Citrobacter amalonaticus]|nr:protein of unknown function [Citrobacter amalonaticus]
MSTTAAIVAPDKINKNKTYHVVIISTYVKVM